MIDDIKANLVTAKVRIGTVLVSNRAFKLNNGEIDYCLCRYYKYNSNNK